MLLDQVQNSRPQDGLPSEKKIPKQVMKITLSSGRDLIDLPPKKSKDVQVELVPQQIDKK